MSVCVHQTHIDGDDVLRTHFVLSAQAYPGLILGHGRIVGHGHGFGLKVLTCRTQLIYGLGSYFGTGVITGDYGVSIIRSVCLSV